MSRLLLIVFIAGCGSLVCPGLAAHATAGQGSGASVTEPVVAGQSGTGAAAGGSEAQPTLSSMREDIKALQTFNKLRENEAGILKVETQKKHKILFIMGICLLLGILTTAGLGLAMVLGDKPVYMWHMAVAGITVTLAIAHAVTSMIWFFPF